MTYTTLTYQGIEKTLADWLVSTWSRTQQNQAGDSFEFTMPLAADANLPFPFDSQIIIQIGRVASNVNPLNPTLPVSVAQVPSVTFSQGKQWFVGYVREPERIGSGTEELLRYKAVGPYERFFSELVFQKLLMTYSPTLKKQIADWQSEIVLGMSLTTLTGSGNTVQGTTATNLLSIAQQLKEIMTYARNASAAEQASNGLGWSGTYQFNCDQLTTAVDGINYDLLQNPSANTLLLDYANSPQTGKTSASTLPAGSYMLRAPLDAVNATTCKECMQRMLQWLGGIGSPVIWTDHSQIPPQLHVATRDQLTTKSLAYTGITVKNQIRRCTELIPPAIHFRYKISGSVLGQPYNVVIDDIASIIGGTSYEGVGQFGQLTKLDGTALPGGTETTLRANALKTRAVVQTLDLTGANVSAQSATVTCQALNLVNPATTGQDGGFWASLFPELSNVAQLQFYNSGNPGVKIIDATTKAVLYQNGAWTGQAYGYRVTDGTPAPWMNDAGGNPGVTTRATLTVRFYYVQKTAGPGTQTAFQGVKDYHEKNITLTLTTLAGGTYTSTPTVTTGEPVPYGLSGYFLALESIPQYEGTITIQEAEITDQVPIGSALNITGGRAEWTAMKACVQSVRYNDNGQTEITFGPAKHLGPTQFLQRLRTNLGPRWYNLINASPTNSTSTNGALGSNVPADAPTNGAENYRLQHFLTSIGTQQGSNATLPGGTHVDSGDWNYSTVNNADPYAFGTGSVPAGVTPFGRGAALIVAHGPSTGSSNDGEKNSWIRLSLADLNGALSGGNAKQIYIQEIPVCVNVNGVNTPMYQLFLCSQPYANSIG